MWGRIVVAVTSASWLFAISDCCSSISRLLKNYYETQFPLVDVAKFRINQIKKHLSKQVEEMNNDSTILTVESCEKRCINIIDSITNMNKLSDSLDIVDGNKTKEFWDGCIRSTNKPLRLKIRNICGDETVWEV